MPATIVDEATDTAREPDVATAAQKSAVTLNYEAMLAALDDLLAEIREERRHAETSSNVVDAQHGQEQATTQPPNVWVEAHAALSRINPKDCPPWTWREIAWRAGSLAVSKGEGMDTNSADRVAVKQLGPERKDK